MQFITNSSEETELIGERLCNALLLRGDKRAFVAMRGEMGVGKTAFARGFARALGISGVKSPTYTIVNEHCGKHPFYHFDMYRILDSDDLYSIGYDDYVNACGFCVVEWSENIETELPSWHITVTIERTSYGDDIRKITVSDGIDL